MIIAWQEIEQGGNFDCRPVWGEGGKQGGINGASGLRLRMELLLGYGGNLMRDAETMGRQGYLQLRLLAGGATQLQ